MGASSSSPAVFSDVSLFRTFSEGIVDTDARAEPSPRGSNDHLLQKSAAFRWDILKRLTGNPVKFVDQFYWHAKVDVRGALMRSVLPVDEECRCRFVETGDTIQDIGSGARWQRRRSCTVVRPLGPRGVVGVPYLATCDATHEQFILKESRILEPPTMFIRRGVSVLRKLSVNYTKLLALGCSPDIPQYVLSSPEYVNETLIGYALEYILNPPTTDASLQYTGTHFRSHCYVQQFDAFVCLKKAFNAMEFAGLGDLGEFVTKHCVGGGDPSSGFGYPADVLLNICQQLVGTLFYLQKGHGFTHSDLKVRNVFCKRLDARRIANVLELGDVRVPNMGFACALADYGKCSISLKMRTGHRFVRLHTEHRRARLLLRTLFKFNPDVTVDPTTNRSSFRFTDNTHLLTLRLFFLGIGTYVSLDTYVVLASLLAVDARATETMGRHPVIRRMLNALWPHEDIVDRALRGIAKTRDVKTRLGLHYAYRFLWGTQMQCSATETAWKILTGSLLV